MSKETRTHLTTRTWTRLNSVNPVSRPGSQLLAHQFALISKASLAVPKSLGPTVTLSTLGYQRPSTSINPLSLDHIPLLHLMHPDSYELMHSPRIPITKRRVSIRSPVFVLLHLLMRTYLQKVTSYSPVASATTATHTDSVDHHPQCILMLTSHTPPQYACACACKFFPLSALSLPSRGNRPLLCV